MQTKKMTIAVTVALAAVAASIAATAHSRRILEDERQVYPLGTLALGEPATVHGCSVRLEAADVSTHVASADTRGWDKRIAESDYRFLRLRLAVENTSDEVINTEALCESLRLVETSTGEVADTDVVWMRGYDALKKRELAPGEQTTGHISLYVYQFVLVFPVVVRMGEDGVAWGVDVIDHDAPVQSML